MKMSTKKAGYPDVKAAVAASKSMGKIAGKVVNEIMKEAVTKGTSFTKVDPWKKESSTSAILYKKMPGDMILITGFRNILTADEIEKKYGKSVIRVYERSDKAIVGRYNGSGEFGIFGPDARAFPGAVYFKKDFAKLVVTLKNAGKLLAGIVAACKNSEVKEVEL
jgi:hypothetical protein